jgi:hypothetical protein
MQPSSGGFLLYTVFSTEAAAFVMPMPTYIFKRIWNRLRTRLNIEFCPQQKSYESIFRCTTKRVQLSKMFCVCILPSLILSSGGNTSSTNTSTNTVDRTCRLKHLMKQAHGLCRHHSTRTELYRHFLDRRPTGNNVQVVIVAPYPSDQLLAAITSREARRIWNIHPVLSSPAYANWVVTTAISLNGIQ